MLVEVNHLVRDYMRIADIVKMRRVHRVFEWDRDTAILVAMVLHHHKHITSNTLRDLRRWNAATLPRRVFELCTSSRNFKGKCPECMSLIHNKYGYRWRYCRKCMKSKPTLVSMWDYWY